MGIWTGWKDKCMTLQSWDTQKMICKQLKPAGSDESMIAISLRTLPMHVGLRADADKYVRSGLSIYLRMY